MSETENEPTQELESPKDEEVEVDGPPTDTREPAARTLKRLGVDALGFPIGS